MLTYTETFSALDFPMLIQINCTFLLIQLLTRLLSLIRKPIPTHSCLL